MPLSFRGRISTWPLLRVPVGVTPFRGHERRSPWLSDGGLFLHERKSRVKGRSEFLER